MSGTSKTSLPKVKATVNRTLLLAVLSLLLCWFYGIPALAMGLLSLKSRQRFSGSRKQLKPATVKKLKWAWQIGWAGTGFSALFTLYYLVALFTSAFISF